MSDSRDKSDDVAFDAFLKGEGELAQKLRELPQPAPSAELDAAILGAIELEMVREAAQTEAGAPPLAANDARVPERKPSFFRRWQAPMAAAACGLFALLIVMRNPPGPGSSAPAPAAAPAEAERREYGLVAKSEDHKDKRANQLILKEDTQVAKRGMDAEAPPPAPAKAQPMPPPMAELATAPAAAPAGAPAPKKEAPPALAQAPGFGAALLKSAPKTSATIGARGLEAEADKPAARLAQVEPSTETAAQKRPDAASQPVFGFMYRSNERVAADMGAPPQEDSRQAGKIAAGGQMAGASQAEASPPARVSAMAAAPVSPNSSRQRHYNPEAESHLMRLEAFVNNDMQKHALEEWDKFRKAYPDYPVPERIESGIRRMQAEIKSGK